MLARQKAQRRQPARDRARQWLIQTLEPGPLTAEAVRYRAHRAGIAWRTLQRARTDIASAQRVGFTRGHWIWTQTAIQQPAGRHETRYCPLCGAERGDPSP